MKIQVTGEQPVDEITVNGGTPSRVIEVAAGLVSSVNGQTGGVTIDAAGVGADPAGAATAAVEAHVEADDPHGDREYADDTFVPTAGGTVTGDLGIDGTLDALGVTDWVNVRRHGAIGAVTDEQPEIQAAVDATPIGGTVYLEARIYRTGSPVRVPPYVTLMGSHGAGEAQPGAPAPVTCLKPLADFDGDAVIEILDQSLGGYSILASQQRIERLTIDGSAVPPENVVDGIRMTGQIQNPIIRDVGIRDTSGKGINTEYNFSAPPGPQAPFCIHMDRVSVMWPKDIGVALNNATDSNLNDVYVLGGSGWGWWISGSGNSTMTACRSEWSGSDGYRITIGPGVLRMIGCSTDRNNGHGLDVRGSDPGFLVLSNCSLTRDGKWFGGGGGNQAALNIQDTTCHVLADGLVVTPGVDDDGGGTQSPQYGVRMIGSAYLALASGLINGVTTAVHDAGGNTTLLRGASLKEATGPSTAVVLDPAALTRTSTGAYSIIGADLRVGTVGRGLRVAEGANGKMNRATLVGGTVTVANTSVTATSEIFAFCQTPGGTPGWLRCSARVVGTSFTILSSSGTDTSVIAWQIFEPA
ncbi:right-handed parallel beta-helix repeat-containing protein [Streptomyces phaeochromogenes]|uniref:right-handed parallel beta-helix repeat-containing protein n=1 Tax=Streptomyces phaeochromogenes TaxID=1923 RepID=UPI002259A9FB|nr:right-handed parallel beta-helix repeat-containing protein [Streptomyces phaeochromogenes]MCX5598433.1 right-handed parallel beta-helix repeat-containing protein [Streptomyces phaeochromogenes]